MEEIIKRINELYAKSKSEGLTDAEKEEQTKLRKKYIEKFRQGVKNTMENVRIVDENGETRKPQRKKKK